MQPAVARVFLSATKDDLARTGHRLAAKDAIIKARCYPVTMEYFVAEDAAPLDVCLREVEQCSALVVVVAHRYGWVPDDQPDPKDKSITRLECEHAKSKGIPIFAFVVDEAHAWTGPREKDRIMRAYETGEDPAKVFAEVRTAEQRLKDFKQWLGDSRIRPTFTAPDSLAVAVGAALHKWQLTAALALATPPPPDEPTAAEKYFEYLRNSTRYIELRGLKGAGKAHQFEIAQLYVDIKTIDGKKVEHALQHDRLLIEGDAGSGKTTFLRRLAGELVKTPVTGFAVLLRVSDLDSHIEESRKLGVKTPRDSPLWIGHLLEAGDWGLSAKSVERRLGQPGAALLLDGLDEAVNEERRQSLLALVQQAAARYPRCRIVVTTRPQAFRDGTALAGFQVAKIEDLDDDAVARFLGLWSRALFPDDTTSATKLADDMGAALRQSAAIRRMTRNPVMLTAMAVVYWNEMRLPEARAELYESVLQWLIRARQHKRLISDRDCLNLHGQLAWKMQSWKGGRIAVVERAQVADALGPQGLDFVEAEVADSGILVSRGSKFQFWHLTFQEYLAARVLAGLTDGEIHKKVDGREYERKWREVMLLLGGVLLAQGESKVNALFEAITAKVGTGLPERAKCVELLSAMLRDMGSSKFQPQCDAYSAMLGEMRRLFVKGGGKGIDIKIRAAAADALGQAGHPGLFLPGDKEYWRPIPGATYKMGDSDWGVRKVTVKPFRIGRYPVTAWEYAKFVEAGGTEPTNWDDQKRYPSRPVVYVSWHDAQAYCKWAKVRLPTEEEWELAARGTDGRTYPWGPDAPTDMHANIFEWRVGAPTPVGLFPDGQSESGCDDMSGNVGEWTDSWYDDKTREARVVRGGSWNLDVHYARCAYRFNFVPEYHYNDLGFRSARI